MRRKYICCIYAVQHFYYNVAWLYYRAAAILVCYSEEGGYSNFGVRESKNRGGSGEGRRKTKLISQSICCKLVRGETTLQSSKKSSSYRLGIKIFHCLYIKYRFTLDRREA